ncbi:MAG: hypothetical protein ACE5K4_04170 [Candidatus Hydrothermarchaeota archaeon]
MFKVGNDIIVDTLKEIKPDVVTLLPGYPLNSAQNAIMDGALGPDVPVLFVSNEADAVGIIIGAGQCGKKGCAVIKDKGVNVAYQLITEEVGTPGVIIVGLDIDGRGSYVCTASLPTVLKESGVITYVPRSIAELSGSIKKAFEDTIIKHRLVAVIITEDLAMQGATSLDLNVIGDRPFVPGDVDPSRIEEAVEYLKMADSVAIIIGKGVVGAERARRGLPGWPSVLGEESVTEVRELARILKEKYNKEVGLYCTRHASEFPETEGFISTGLSSGVFVEAEVTFMVGMSWDLFAVKFETECLISINLDPLAASIEMADVPLVGSAKRALQEINAKLLEVDVI